MIDKTDPWWTIFKPDVRGAVTVGYFILAFRLLYMIEGHAELLKDAAFMTIATMILGSGGLGIIATFLFGGTATGSKVMEAQSKAVASVATSSGTGNGAGPIGSPTDPQAVVIHQPEGEPVPVTDAGPTGPTGP